MSFLKIANDKFQGSKFISYDQSLEEFICECYVKLPPCSYGSRIADKIRELLDADYVSPKLGRGDFSYNGVFYEQKVSFLSSISDKWSITHIRPWQKFSFFSFCFIDCKNNFKPLFYVIPRNTIHRLRLAAMNGTETSNTENSNIELRTDIKRDSHEHLMIRLDFTRLTDENGFISTSFDSFKKFVHNTKKFE